MTAVLVWGGYIHTVRIQLLLWECEFWDLNIKAEFYAIPLLCIYSENGCFCLLYSILCFYALFNYIHTMAPFFYQISLSLTLHCPYPYSFVALQPTQWCALKSDCEAFINCKSAHCLPVYVFVYTFIVTDNNLITERFLQDGFSVGKSKLHTNWTRADIWTHNSHCESHSAP